MTLDALKEFGFPVAVALFLLYDFIKGRKNNEARIERLEEYCFNRLETLVSTSIKVQRQLTEEMRKRPCLKDIKDEPNQKQLETSNIRS